MCAGSSAVGWSSRLVVPEAAERSWVVLPARLEAVWNSQYPSGGNDGLLWAGRGLSTQARVGVAGRWGVVSAALAPELAWQQNDWFETVSTGKSGDPPSRIPGTATRSTRPSASGPGRSPRRDWGRAT